MQASQHCGGPTVPTTHVTPWARPCCTACYDASGQASALAFVHTLGPLVVSSSFFSTHDDDAWPCLWSRVRTSV